MIELIGEEHRQECPKFAPDLDDSRFVLNATVFGRRERERMTDYIKREDAIKIINSFVWSNSADHTRHDSLIALFKFIESTEVVEVVRCKDCRWWDNEDDAERCAHKYSGMWAKSDGYCSYGERTDA